MFINHFLRVLAACFAIAAGSAALLGQDNPPEPLSIGIKEAPPFAMKSSSGEWSGLSVELWREVAAELEIEYVWQEDSLDGLIEKVGNGQLAAAIAAISLTSERESVVDFSHPYYSTGLGIAVVDSGGGLNWYAALQSFFSWQFLSALFALFVVLLGAGFALWIFERRKNKEQFGGRPIEGLGASLWWSAVTMTTVGYGDKAPVTVGGRVVALVWMFTSIIIISGFTASIATSLTVNSMDQAIESEEDLGGALVATLQDSTSLAYLKERGIRNQSFTELDEALDSLLQDEADAVVYDRATLRYETRNSKKLSVLESVFKQQLYAIALPKDSLWRERINLQLLRLQESGFLRDKLQEYAIE